MVVIVQALWKEKNVCGINKLNEHDPVKVRQLGKESLCAPAHSCIIYVRLKKIFSLCVIFPLPPWGLIQVFSHEPQHFKLRHWHPGFKNA